MYSISIFPHILNYCWSFKARLVHRFARPSSVLINKLLDDINDLRKHPSEDISQYITRAKSTARTIRASALSVISSIVFSLVFLASMMAFGMLFPSIGTYDLDNLTQSLLKTESRLSTRSRHRSASPRPSSGPTSYRDRPRAPLAPLPPQPLPPASTSLRPATVLPQYRPRWCTQYGKTGHTVEDCWELYPEQRRYCRGFSSSSLTSSRHDSFSFIEKSTGNGFIHILIVQCIMAY